MIAGCDSAPSAIPAASVADDAYKMMACEALEKERARVASTLHAVTGDQQSRASRDAFAAAAGATVSPLFYVLLTGETASASEVSRLKGELQAIERVAREKKCSQSM